MKRRVVNSDMSALTTEYVPPNRPYSQKELCYLRGVLKKKLRLGTNLVTHTMCNHSYLVREISRKEKELKEKNSNEDIGNCSVCWKLRNTPYELKSTAGSLVNTFCNSVFAKEADPDTRLSFDLLDLESVYYHWLYVDDYQEYR